MNDGYEVVSLRYIYATAFDTFIRQPSIHFYIFYRKSKNTQSDNVSWAFS